MQDGVGGVSKAVAHMNLHGQPYNCIAVESDPVQWKACATGIQELIERQTTKVRNLYLFFVFFSIKGVQEKALREFVTEEQEKSAPAKVSEDQIGEKNEKDEKVEKPIPDFQINEKGQEYVTIEVTLHSLVTMS